MTHRVPIYDSYYNEIRPLIDSNKARLKQPLHHIGRFKPACQIVNYQLHFAVGF